MGQYHLTIVHIQIQKMNELIYGAPQFINAQFLSGEASHHGKEFFDLNRKFSTVSGVQDW
jgi:hypothetical protein